MPNRKLFPKYPPEWEQHPQVLSKRIGAVEDHLEQAPPSNSASQGLFAPILVLLVQILSALSLVSQEFRDSVLKVLGHG